MWEFSLLRLNQLGYFEQLKPDDPNVTERHLDEKDGTVDLTLKVKEKGKNSIGLTGGVSGLAGSFVGINYATNNFLGLGETLTVQVNLGTRQRRLRCSDLPSPICLIAPCISDSRLHPAFQLRPGAEKLQILTGQQLNLPSAIAAKSAELHPVQQWLFTSPGSYPLQRSFKRLGLTYSFDDSSISAFSDASKSLFTNLAFRGINGPNSLDGIVTSKIFPSFSFNTIDAAYHPHRAQLFPGG